MLQASRQIAEMAAGAIHIIAQIEAIESAIQKSPAFVFDLSKSLIDIVCKTILKDRGVDPQNKFDTPQLLKETLKILPLHHDDIDRTEKTYESLKKIANGLQTAVAGVCELRNMHGIIGHGQDGYALTLESIHAHFVASAADTIVHILYRSHKNYPNSTNSSRIVYQDYEKENIIIDETLDDDYLVDFSKKFRPSELIYKMDVESYKSIILDIKDKDY